jgi:hypothetical protein
MHVYLNQDVRPKQQLTVRKVPKAWEIEADAIVIEMPGKGVIEQCTHPTDLVNAAFFVDKPGQLGKLRLVLDFVPLNKVVRRPVHPFPCPDDISNSL